MIWTVFSTQEMLLYNQKDIRSLRYWFLIENSVLISVIDATLRLLIDGIKIYKSDKKLKKEINLMAKFTKRYEIYGESGVEHNLILQG